MSAGHAHADHHGNKEVALLISILALVLAPASSITTMPALAWIAGALGVVGVVFCGIGFFAPTAVHLF